MRTLYLLRHAKSSWDHPGLGDHDRPLAPRGLKAAPAMGRFMARERLIPHRALCSSALRARETWELVASELGRQVPTEIRSEIYHSSPGTLQGLIRSASDNDPSLALIGHNPTMEDLALTLAGSGPMTDMDRLRAKFPTGALAVLDFGVDRWSDVKEGAGFLRMFVKPKGLKGGA